jgi:hypothetical protein
VEIEESSRQAVLGGVKRHVLTPTAFVHRARDPSPDRREVAAVQEVEEVVDDPLGVELNVGDSGVAQLALIPELASGLGVEDGALEEDAWSAVVVAVARDGRRVRKLEWVSIVEAGRRHGAIIGQRRLSRFTAELIQRRQRMRPRKQGLVCEWTIAWSASSAWSW